MDDRARAIEVLERARDLLAERLTERVLESRDQILEDAAGLTFLSEIETIYEQIGARLHHVRSMLASLPQAEAAAEPHRSQPMAKRPATVAFPSLPAPRPIAGLLPSAGEALSLKAFLVQIETGDVASAGQTLAELFNMDLQRGTRLAIEFSRRIERQPEILLKAVHLRSELASGRTNRLLRLLWECFGLQGSESIDVVHTLRARLAG